MSFSFNTSLSGLNANANAINVVGNNIANANTIGFRSSFVTFMDVYSNPLGVRLNGGGNPRQIGNGVQTAAVHTDFSQGSLNESSSPLHAAIQGEGFFTLKNVDGTTGYTRAGDFTINQEGTLVAPSGAEVQGYLAQNGTIPQGAVLTSLKIPIGETLAPQSTNEATVRMNLDSEIEAGTIFNSTLQVFDSKGVSRTLNMSFERQTDGTFQMTATLDGNTAETISNAGTATTTPVTFDFDSNGELTSPTSLSVVPDQAMLDGATLPEIDIALRETNPDGSPGAFNITSYSLPSAVGSINQNGFPAGELQGATVDANGTIFGNLSNGQSRTIGQYAVATFNSTSGLRRQGNNAMGETISSGQATIGVPGTGGRGTISGGFLEQSNVNITNEFVELIEAQRGFQANSRVLSGLNQTFQEILQIL